MNPILEFFNGLGPWNWFVLAAGLALLETVIPGVHFMWFALAAVIMGGVGLMVPMPIPLQLILFALLAIATIFIARRFYSGRDITTDVPALNDRGLQYVGRTVTVVEPIANGRGKVSVGDTVWAAEGDDAPEGSRVKVLGVSGTILKVG